ncbi:MAG: tyrosine-type recombinase/integrase [Nitrospirota bacterium]
MPKGIQPEGKCPECKGPFKWDERRGYVCPIHFLPPKRFTIYFNHEGERVSRGHTLEGKPLTNHYMAQALYELAMDQKSVPGKFDITVWKSKRALEYQFNRLIAKWEREKISTLKKGSYKNIKTYCKQFAAFYGDRDVREIRNTKDYYQTLKNSISVINAKMDTLKSFFRWLIEDERIIPAPGPSFPKLEEPPEHEPITVSREIQEQILNFIPEIHQPLFRYMVYQGCRPNEARALKWDSIDLENMMVTYKRGFSIDDLNEHTKTKDIIHNPLFPETVAVLPHRSFDLDFVFKFRGAPYKYNTVGAIFTAALKRFNKITGNNLQITMYEFIKHSFGTQLVNKGLPIEVMQQWWGHEDSKMTKKYAKLKIVDHLRREVEKIYPIKKVVEGSQ